ncbi:hypothetical protein AB0E01_23185 [Nocardia vinacea]|uniref:hypothetical protein n=1 Tax=Nocardia vinacea TaxID=96468 RepID=UPI0033F85FC8
MTATKTGLEWLIVGATVAYVTGGYTQENVIQAAVDKIGKRDVVVTVDGRTETFNINKTSLRSGPNTWLRRSGSSQWDRGTQLAPLDDPQVVKIQARQVRADATSKVWRYADEFQSTRDVATARKLRDAIDVYLNLHAEDDGRDDHPR